MLCGYSGSGYKQTLLQPCMETKAVTLSTPELMIPAPQTLFRLPILLAEHRG